MEEVIGQAVLFFLVGMNTTATSIAFLIYNLAVYPEIQEKLYDEIVDVAGDKVNEIKQFVAANKSRRKEKSLDLQMRFYCHYWKNVSFLTSTVNSLADLRGRLGSLPRSNFIHFHANFWGKFHQIIGKRPQLWGWRPILWEILDPPPVSKLFKFTWVMKSQSTAQLFFQKSSWSCSIMSLLFIFAGNRL